MATRQAFLVMEDGMVAYKVRPPFLGCTKLTASIRMRMITSYGREL